MNMAENFAALMLFEMLAGLTMFCVLAATAYWKIRGLRREMQELDERLNGVAGQMSTIHTQLHGLRAEAAYKVSNAELEHTLSMMAMRNHFGQDHKAGMAVQKTRGKQ